MKRTLCAALAVAMLLGLGVTAQAAEGVSICVPGTYVTGIDTDGDGAADVTAADADSPVKGSHIIDYDAQVVSLNGQTYTAANAPVILNTGAAGYGSQNNSAASADHAADGYINMSCGNRGKQDTATGSDGSTLYATDVTATTEGESSAAIRSDRVGGLMVVSGGSYTSKAPALQWSTARPPSPQKMPISPPTAPRRSASRGLNSLYLYDCDLTGAMQDSQQNDCTWNVILYQSMSGDSQVGNSTFQMTDGTLTAKNGGMFYTTNTESTFILKNVQIVCGEDSPFFLRCTGNQNQRG